MPHALAAAPLSVEPPPRAITARSVLIGTLCVFLICALTPLNDFIFSDTSVTAGFLPLGAVLIEFLLIVGINAPLHRFAPHRALQTGELAVIVLMTLVCCGLPNWGLMRFFIPTPVAPFYVAALDGQFWQAFLKMRLPAWLFPVGGIPQGPGDPVVSWFYNSVPNGEPIPFRAWLRPLAVWGVFAVAMIATLAALARLVITQWMMNERLPFPLVQVQASLIEPPPRGRALNDLFRSRLLWIGLLTVFAVHGLTILNTYLPRYFVRLPLSYDLTGLFGADPIPGNPFSQLDSKLKKAALSFIVVGVTYFIRSRVAFSLWGFFILTNLVTVQVAMTGGEIQSAAWADQHLGACFAFALGIFFIGRAHWARVLRNAFGVGADATYRVAFWLATGGIIVMLAWLILAGVQVWLAGAIVLFILAAHLIVARVVAETGLPFYRSSIAVAQLYTQFPPTMLTGRDVYFSGVFTALGPIATRDSVTVFTSTGLGICQAREMAGNRLAVKLGGVIVWALMVGFAVSAYTTLWCQYSYATPPRDAVPAGNSFGAVYIPQRETTIPVTSHSQGRFQPRQHTPWVHMTIGFVAMSALEVASLRWSGWPLLPVGYVTSFGAFIGNAWFSIFIGWLAKVLIVRFGGAKLFDSIRPLFVGIIFGEALAAGTWLIVNFIVVMNGGESQAVKFLI